MLQKSIRRASEELQVLKLEGDMEQVKVRRCSTAERVWKNEFLRCKVRVLHEQPSRSMSSVLLQLDCSDGSGLVAAQFSGDQSEQQQQS